MDREEILIGRYLPNAVPVRTLSNVYIVPIELPRFPYRLIGEFRELGTTNKQKIISTIMTIFIEE